MNLRHSNQILSTILTIDSSVLSGAEKLILQVIAQHCKKDHLGNWTSFPSYEKIAKITGYSTETVRRHRMSLEKKGFIKVAKKKREDKPSNHLHNFYTIVISMLGFNCDKIKAAKTSLSKAKKALQSAFKKPKSNQPVQVQDSNSFNSCRALFINNPKELTQTQIQILKDNVSKLSPVEELQLGFLN